MQRLGLAGALVGLLATQGCSARHQPLEVAPSVTPPTRFTQAPSDDSGVQPVRWWEAFPDSDLHQMIVTALEANLDLQASWARLRQAMQQGRVAWSQSKGAVDFEVSGGRNQLFLPGGARAVDRNSVGFPASWELDLWGRLRSSTQAAYLDAEAARADTEALALSLTAEVGLSWVGVLEQRARRRLLEEQLDTNRDLLDAIRIRFGHGQSTGLDFFQQRQLLEGTQARLALIAAEESTHAHRLAVLLGRAPGEQPLPHRVRLPYLASLPRLGIPSGLLSSRPDLRGAFRRVEAADRRVAAALRDRLPSIRLTGSLTTQASKPSALFRGVLRSLFANLALPVLDGGRRRAEVARSRAQAHERLLAFQAAFLSALEEVETALAREHAQRAYLAQLQLQESSTRKAFEVASARYLEGAEDFLRVLTSLGALHQVQQQQVEGRAQLLRHRIALHRALGGDWTTRLVPPNRWKEGA